jgi:hypothetical protein
VKSNIKKNCPIYILEISAEGRGLCGNGRKDSNEECDGGYNGDFCCDSECKLRSGAQCR